MHRLPILALVALLFTLPTACACWGQAAPEEPAYRPTPGESGPRVMKVTGRVFENAHRLIPGMSTREIIDALTLDEEEIHFSNLFGGHFDVYVYDLPELNCRLSIALYGNDARGIWMRWVTESTDMTMFNYHLPPPSDHMPSLVENA